MRLFGFALFTQLAFSGHLLKSKLHKIVFFFRRRSQDRDVRHPVFFGRSRPDLQDQFRRRRRQDDHHRGRKDQGRGKAFQGRRLARKASFRFEHQR